MHNAAAVAITAAWLALFAPAPFGPPKPPPEVPIGGHVMTWRGVDCETYFRPHGAFYCQWMGKPWHGVYRCKDGVLTVEEWPGDDERRELARIKWSVKLLSSTNGELVGANGDHQKWKLVPLKLRRH